MNIMHSNKDPTLETTPEDALLFGYPIKIIISQIHNIKYNLHSFVGPSSFPFIKHLYLLSKTLMRGY